LLKKAKQLARREKVTLRSLTEEGLTRVINERAGRKPGEVEPVTFRGKGLSKEFKGAGWPEIRDAAYQRHGS
jgi:hypothetical protein